MHFYNAFQSFNLNFWPNSSNKIHTRFVCCNIILLLSFLQCKLKYFTCLLFSVVFCKWSNKYSLLIPKWIMSPVAYSFTHFISLNPTHDTYLWLHVQITEQKISNINRELYPTQSQLHNLTIQVQNVESTSIDTQYNFLTSVTLHIYNVR